MLAVLLYSIHVLTSIFLILVVLLQQGKGADLSVFGGGATMTAFGARGAASLLHKFTVGGFVVFILTTLAIGVYQTSNLDSVTRGLPDADKSATAAPSADEDAAASEEDGEVPGVLPEAEEPAVSANEEEEEGAGPAEAPPETEAPPEDAPPSEGGSGN